MWKRVGRRRHGAAAAAFPTPIGGVRRGLACKLLVLVVSVFGYFWKILRWKKKIQGDQIERLGHKNRRTSL